MAGSFDIWNSERREVLCVDNSEMGMMVSSHNHSLLEIGKHYTVSGVEVNAWYTLVRLEEFPGRTFNSVAFNEIAMPESVVEEMKAVYQMRYGKSL